MFLPSDNLLMLLITESVNLTSHKKLNRKHFLLFQTFEEIKSLHLVTASTFWVGSRLSSTSIVAQQMRGVGAAVASHIYILEEINQKQLCSWVPVKLCLLIG